MKHIYSTTFDANLVRVFLAVWDTRSITDAADRLGLTQPAVSHALKRLRERFDDPLFIRSAKGMTPTDAATRLHPPFENAFAAIARAVEDRAFSPAVSRRTFRIAMSDVSEQYFLPRLLAMLQVEAPDVTIDIVPFATDSVAPQLRSGEADFALGYLPQIEAECISELLLIDQLVCLVRAGHPALDLPFTLDAFCALPQIDAASAAAGHSAIDKYLSSQSRCRQVAVTIRHLLTAPALIDETDLGVIFPESLAEKINRDGRYRALQLPIPSPQIEVKIHYHQRFAADGGIRWFVQTIRTMFQGESRSALAFPLTGGDTRADKVNT